MNFQVYVKGEKQNGVVSAKDKEAARDFYLNSLERLGETFPGYPVPDREDVAVVEYRTDESGSLTVQ